MKFFVVVCYLLLLGSNSAFALEAEIQEDIRKFSGQKSRACLLLQDYTTTLNLSKSDVLKQRTARKIAMILGEGKGVGGFKKNRKATSEEKGIMVRALDAAYQYYPLQDNDFFMVSSPDAEIKKHQAVLWGLSKTIGIRATQRMYEKEKEAEQHSEEERIVRVDISYADFNKEVRPDLKKFEDEDNRRKLAVPRDYKKLLLQEYTAKLLTDLDSSSRANISRKKEILESNIKFNAELNAISQKFLDYQTFRRDSSVKMCGSLPPDIIFETPKDRDRL